MREERGFSMIELEMKQWGKELAFVKEDEAALRDYEEGYKQVCDRLKELARETVASWEPAYREIRSDVEQGIETGMLNDTLERLEGFLRRSKAALTEYRRRKGENVVVCRKPAVDVKKYRIERKKMEGVVKDVQSRVAELVAETNREATIALDYLRDINAEAKEMYDTLQKRVERAHAILALDEPKELLQAVHFRLVQAGKLAIAYADFARILAEGRGSLQFMGKQNELAYLLLFLDRNGLVHNWKGLSLFYESKGVSKAVTAQNIVEAQKKLSSRNDPAIKAMLVALRETFPQVLIS